VSVAPSFRVANTGTISLFRDGGTLRALGGRLLFVSPSLEGDLRFMPELVLVLAAAGLAAAAVPKDFRQIYWLKRALVVFHSFRNSFRIFDSFRNITQREPVHQHLQAIRV
jgi:hypothetical protein